MKTPRGWRNTCVGTYTPTPPPPPPPPPTPTTTTVATMATITTMATIAKLTRRVPVPVTVLMTQTTTNHHNYHCRIDGPTTTRPIKRLVPWCPPRSYGTSSLPTAPPPTPHGPQEGSSHLNSGYLRPCSVCSTHGAWGPISWWFTRPPGRWWQQG